MSRISGFDPDVQGHNFREVRRRTSSMGVFNDRTSVERILFAVSTRENRTASSSPDSQFLTSPGAE